jgi:hypothetical protein
MMFVKGVESQPRKAPAGIAHDIVDGISYVKRTPPVLTIVAIGLTMGLFIHPSTQLMPAFAKESLSASPAAAGTLLMMAGVGSLAGNSTLALLGNVRRKNYIAIAMAFLYGLGILLMSINPWYITALPIMAMIGMGRMVCVSIGSTIIQLIVPPAYLGRASSLWQSGAALRLTGTIYMGFAWDLLGQRLVMAGGALIYLVVMALVTLVNPGLRKLDPDKMEPAASLSR